MGVALTSCTVPMVGKPTFELRRRRDGARRRHPRRAGPRAAAAAPARTRSSRCSTRPSSTTCPSLRRPRAGLRQRPRRDAAHGALHRLSTSSTALLEERGLEIARNLVGPYMTALDMAGCSITLLRLDDELTELWDAPVVTPGLRWGA